MTPEFDDLSKGDAATSGLRAFAETGDEYAFRRVVECHLGLVLGTARRQTRDETAARDVAQEVFSALARKARPLARHPHLAAWLHRAVILECRRHRRRLMNHQRRMNDISDHVRAQADGRDVWNDVLPVLDEAIEALPAPDRRVILLRFFERLSFREIGLRAGKSDDAAQKQTARAVEKLARHLERRGVAMPLPVLAAGLASLGPGTASAALCASIASAACHPTVSSGPVILIETIARIMNSRSKFSLIAGGLAAVGLVWQAGLIRQLRTEVARLTTGVAESTNNRRLPVNHTMAVRHQRPGGALIDREPDVPDDLAPSGAVAWEQALLEADPLRRSARIAALLNGLTPAEAPAVASVFERLIAEGRSFSSEQALFLRAWGRVDGLAAVTRASGSGSKSATPGSLAALAGWAAADPAAARQWLDGLADESARQSLAYGLLDGWALRDFDAAAEWALMLPRSDTREQIRRLLLERCLAAGDIPAAQSWLDTLPDDDHNQLFKQRTCDDIIATMLLREPSAAAEWIRQLGDQSFLSPAAIARTAARLAESAPADSLRWLGSLATANPGITAGGFAGVIGKWSETDPAAAGTWLRDHASHPAYDQMAAAHARSVSDEDPDTALAWAGSLRDPELRERSVLDLGRRILQSRGDEGAAILTTAGFTDAQIAEARSAPSQPSYARLSYGIDVVRRGVDSLAMLTEDIIGSTSGGHETGALTIWTKNFQQEGSSATTALDVSSGLPGAASFELFLTEGQNDDVSAPGGGGVEERQALGPHGPDFASRDCRTCHQPGSR